MFKIRPIRVLTLVLIAIGASSAASAATIPGVDAIDDLVWTRDWQIEIDSEPVDGVNVYYSAYEVAWLATVPDVGVLLISPRGQSVQRVDPERFNASSEGATLAANAAVETLGQFEQRVAGGRHFEIGETAIALVPSPPLLGRQSLRTVETRHPTFSTRAAAYRSKMTSTPLLRTGQANQDEITVRVYFGSWSPICQRILPKFLALEDAWQGQGVRFEYFGLPKPLTDDPHALEQRITGVPTVVVLDGDDEIDRLVGRQLDDPASALSRALGVQ